MYTIYLSIGTNKGDKKQHIQNAISLINQRIGPIKNIAPLYETKAWGFDGEDFYNTCVIAKTTLPATTLLKKTQDIEKELGRKKTKTTEYTNRVIDIDILLIDQLIIQTKNLTVPHPKMLERNFVLAPLADIAPEISHPTHKKTIIHHQIKCSDNTQIKKTALSLDKPVRPKLIVIEGNIGAGKTSLSKKLNKYFNSDILLEEYKENPFLANFYTNPKKYAFLLEASFLMDRNEQIQHKLKSNSDLVVSDYHISKSLIFAKSTLNNQELKLYKKIFSLTETEIKKPDLYVYLDQTTDRLLENIKNRDRSFEKNIQIEYLEKINNNYLNFIESKKIENILRIDVTSLDFVNNEEDFQFILNKITTNLF